VTEFWERVGSVEWLADVGVPLAGTVLAIVLAGLGIRRQLAQTRSCGKRRDTPRRRVRSG
jgi:hypothetical protein